jgi:hypothetical protein
MEIHLFCRCDGLDGNNNLHLINVHSAVYTYTSILFTDCPALIHPEIVLYILQGITDVLVLYHHRNHPQSA